MHGYGGGILWIDLSNRTFHIEPSIPQLCRLYLGGRGLNIRRLKDLTKRETDPLSPGNPVIFSAGPLAGTPVPGGARFNVTSLSPQTGILGDSNAGGFFGPEMKFAGFDQIVIQGKSESPVFLFICNNQIQFLDASHLWGMDIRETTAHIREELRDREIQVAAIGPAAENGVLFSGVFANLVRAAARTGIGRVLAAKNIKAVAVRGTRLLSIADKTRFLNNLSNLDKKIYQHPEFSIRNRLGTTKLVMALNAIGALPTRHFQSGHFEHADKVSGEAIEAQYKIKNKSCFACTIHCSRFIQVPDPRFENLRYEGPEYEPLAGFSARIGNPDLPLALHCIDLANRFGMDAISLSEVISWSMECYQNGILTRNDADGLDLSWGKGESIVELIHKIARREGFGDLLADGVRKAAVQLGRNSEELAFHSKGLEIFQADVRAIKGYGLGNAVSSRGADHLRSEPWFEFSNDSNEGIKRYGIPETAFRLEYKGKGRVVKHFEEMAAISDATGICKNIYNNMEVLDWQETAELLSSLTGWDMDGEEVREVGERIVNLERLLNLRQGLTRKDDDLPSRFKDTPLQAEGASRGARLELNEMVNEYYYVRGWDLETGHPLTETIRRLGLETE